MSTRAEFREDEAAVLEAEIAEQCGILNVATGRLVSLIGQVLAAEPARSARVTQLIAHAEPLHLRYRCPSVQDRARRRRP